MGRWRRRVRSLGQAFVDVLEAEVADLVAELQKTSRGWLKALGFFSAAATTAIGAVLVFTAFLVALLSVWMKTWQAAGIVFLLLIFVTAGLAYGGWRSFRRQRAPTDIVRGHLEDHLEWWRRGLSPNSSGIGRRSIADEAANEPPGAAVPPGPVTEARRESAGDPGSLPPERNPERKPERKEEP